MNAKPITISQFVDGYMAVHPDENRDTLNCKVYRWIKNGHLAADRTPNDGGILMTTVDPATFTPPLQGPNPEGEGLRVREVARLLGVPRPTIYSWLRRAGLDGGRVPEELLEEWQNAGKGRV